MNIYYRVLYFCWNYCCWAIWFCIWRLLWLSWYGVNYLIIIFELFRYGTSLRIKEIASFYLYSIVRYVLTYEHILLLFSIDEYYCVERWNDVTGNRWFDIICVVDVVYCIDDIVVARVGCDVSLMLLVAVVRERRLLILLMVILVAVHKQWNEYSCYDFSCIMMLI